MRCISLETGSCWAPRARRSLFPPRFMPSGPSRLLCVPAEPVPHGECVWARLQCSLFPELGPTVVSETPKERVWVNALSRPYLAHRVLPSAGQSCDLMEMGRE